MKNKKKYRIYNQFVNLKYCEICNDPLHPSITHALLIDLNDKAIKAGHWGCINKEVEKLNKEFGL